MAQKTELQLRAESVDLLGRIPRAGGYTASFQLSIRLTEVYAELEQLHIQSLADDRNDEPAACGLPAPVRPPVAGKDRNVQGVILNQGRRAWGLIRSCWCTIVYEHGASSPRQVHRRAMEMKHGYPPIAPASTIDGLDWAIITGLVCATVFLVVLVLVLSNSIGSMGLEWIGNMVNE